MLLWLITGKFDRFRPLLRIDIYELPEICEGSGATLVSNLREKAKLPRETGFFAQR